MIRQRVDLAIPVTELCLHGVLAGEQAQLGAMKSGAEQRVDRRLKVLRAVENANSFADCAGLLLDRHGSYYYLRAVKIVRLSRFLQLASRSILHRRTHPNIAPANTSDKRI